MCLYCNSLHYPLCLKSRFFLLAHLRVKHLDSNEFKVGRAKNPSLVVAEKDVNASDATAPKQGAKGVFITCS